MTPGKEKGFNAMRIIDSSSTFKLPGSVRKVLLIQLGDIGDVVWTTPSIRAVKNSLPGSKVSVMVKDGFGGLLEVDPSIESIFEVKSYHGNLFHQATGQLSFIRELRAQHFDLVVDLRLGDRGAFMSFASGAPIRVTFYQSWGLPRWRWFFFTHGVVPGPSVYTRGATDQSLRILREIGIDTKDIIPKLWVSDTVKKRVQEILTGEKMDRYNRWITINPYSRWTYKEWSDPKWIDIIQWLWKEFAMPTIVIGSPDENSKVEALIRQCTTPAFNFAGKTTLAELAGLLKLSHLHIGVDSAGPHIAAATGTPTVTIYGPSSWQDWAPVGEQHRVVLPDMDCVPCKKKGCNHSGRSLCLKALSTDSVKSVISEIMKKP
ncbi:MAG: glycosyltransferase family 9 protein [Smithellaceae bacterium]